MAILTVRKAPDEAHRTQRQRATQDEHSTEAETRETLSSEVRAEKPVSLGDALAALARKIDLTNKDFAAIDQTRNKTPAEPTTFE